MSQTNLWVSSVVGDNSVADPVSRVWTDEPHFSNDRPIATSWYTARRCYDEVYTIVYFAKGRRRTQYTIHLSLRAVYLLKRIGPTYFQLKKYVAASGPTDNLIELLLLGV